MRILFLSRWFPYPPDNGSKIRIFNILKQLSRHHQVALLAFGESADLVDTSALLALREHCCSVRVLPNRAFRPSSTKALLGLLSSQPRSLVDTYSGAMSAAVLDEVEKHDFDLVVASQLGMVPYALTLRALPALLEELELSVLMGAMKQRTRLPRRLRTFLTWLKLSAYLRRILPRFAACTVVSDLERKNLRMAAPGYANVKVIPNAVDLSRYDGHFGPPRPNTLVYSGALTYDANYDAVRNFLADVYPSIIRAVPDLVFRVTGNSVGADLASLPRHPGVQYTGYVADVRPVVAQSWASVAPLRIGGGTRLKILESMALGTPVVSTSKGAEGLEVTDGENILIADDPEAFADRAVGLLRSAKVRSRLAAGGRHLVESRHDWNVVGKEFCALVEQVAASRAG